jgi:hypothetical protein
MDRLMLHEDEFEHPAVATAASTVVTAIELMDESSRDADLGEIEWDDAVRLLAALRDARKRLVGIEAAFERYIDRQWRRQKVTGPVAVEGVGQVEVYRSRERHGWDHPALAAAVVEANMPTTGEVPDPWDVRDWLMAAAGVGYWRVTALRNLGIDPDGYCTSEPGPPSVKIT